jgi:Ran-binding protein 1
MKLAPNLGSDRAWVWNVSADYAEAEPTAETFAIRFANSESESPRLWVMQVVRGLVVVRC